MDVVKPKRPPVLIDVAKPKPLRSFVNIVRPPVPVHAVGPEPMGVPTGNGRQRKMNTLSIREELKKGLAVLEETKGTVAKRPACGGDIGPIAKRPAGLIAKRPAASDGRSKEAFFWQG